ncbi:exodeoxyribonuclease III family protein [Mycobacterium intracellulare 1956]|uniref:Exodeoxyribonuclease III family protein n=1 Tax=Mycobacterium intracellulare 1956 TaxID=1299331 RepID=X8CDU6_MYCIT|nr:exodeoxyribonuclease III family protein [Mycobacterium intracellulare 1956]
MRIATWNVNSIRSRLPRVLDWLARTDVDVLAMQETKCSDSQFPTLPFFELGYEVAHVGFNQWNGVAIASRVGLDDVQIGFDGQPTWSGKPEVAAVAEARALAATCGGVRLWSLYVPNGRALGDPHYAYKLDWLAALRDSAEGWLRDDPAPRSRWPATGISLHRTTTCGAWSSLPAPRTSPHRSAARSTRSSRRNSPTWYGLSHRARRLHVLGLHPAAVPEAARHAHRLHPGLTGIGESRDRRADRPRGTQRQGRQRSRARARRSARRLTPRPGVG